MRLLFIAFLLAFSTSVNAQQIGSGTQVLSRLYVTGSVVGNGADTTEDTLQSYVLPAGTLANVGDTIHIMASGAAAASTDNKVYRVRIGSGAGNIVTSGTLLTLSGIRWAVDVYIVKTGSNTQSFYAMGRVSNATTSDGTLSGTLSGTDTAAITISITGQDTTASTANAVTCQYFSVDFLRAPPS